MTTVDEAVEAGARAAADLWDDATEYGSHEDLASVAIRAAWPILSAGLRVINTGDNRALYGNDFEAGMAKALWLVKGELDRIDRGLGL